MKRPILKTFLAENVSPQEAFSNYACALEKYVVYLEHSKQHKIKYLLNHEPSKKIGVVFKVHKHKFNDGIKLAEQVYKVARKFGYTTMLTDFDFTDEKFNKILMYKFTDYEK